MEKKDKDAVQVPPAKKKGGRPEKVTFDDNRAEMVKRYKRDENGLLENVPHEFNEDGSVNWKAMIPKKHIVFFDEWFERNNIEMPKGKSLADVENPEEYKDEQLLILLAGFKEVARIRGINNVSRKVCESSFERAVVSTTVEVIPNYETSFNSLTYTGTANATVHNTSDNYQAFLESIAANRSFVRAIRNALNIEVVGKDEVADATYESGKEDVGATDPSQTLAVIAADYSTEMDGKMTKLDSFKKFRRFLVEKGIKDASEWEDWKDIPIALIWKLISQIKKAATSTL